MKFCSCLFCALLLLTGLLPVTPAVAVTLGQTDNFEDGTTQGWLVGLLGAPHPAPPQNIPSGGPAGTDDNFLLLTSVGGAGAGSRLTAINLGAQWAGDYLASGVGTILMDVNNFGDSDLSLRLLVADPTVGPPDNQAFSTNPVIVLAHSGWTRVIFPFSPGDLTPDLGSVVTALTNATELRIFHSTAVDFPGEAVVAKLGVDNITAVPLPSTALLLLGSGLLALLASQKKLFN
jgi:hypothetical protein